MFRALVRTALSLAALPASADGPADPLARDFAQPPDHARPWVWGHWLHGNVDRETITRELTAMKRVGLGGVTMFDVAQPGIPAGPHRYLDADWQKLFAWQITEAKRLGLEVMSHNGPGYSGNGGPWIPAELGSQKIVDTATRHPGGRRFTGTLPRPAANGGHYRDVAVLAVRESAPPAAPAIEDFDMKRLVWLNYIRWKGTRSAPHDAALPADRCIPLDHVLVLTDRMSPDGRLDWDAPPGSWTLLRIGHTWTGQKTLPATPDSEGPECDKLDPQGIRTHFDHVMRRMVELAGPEAGKTFHTFFVDSWEAGGQNWTARMPEEFRKRRGYDIVPFLPVLTGRVIADLRTSERFLFDLRLTVSELVTENFWAELRRLCHARGMRLAVQPYITTGNDLDAANHCDEPTGEIWSHPFQPNDYSLTLKAAASTANLNGHAIVGAEAFTASEKERWLAHPATLKEFADRAFCLGANRLQVHRFAMQRFPQAKPGMTMGKWGQHYDSSQTWWEWTRPWHDHLARCQLMLRQGPVVTDVLALGSEEPLERFEHRPIPGHDYDACGPDSFRRLAMNDGLPAIPGGPRYRLITVNHNGTMSPARLRRLRDLVRDGAALLGDPPLAAPGLEGQPQADAEVQEIAREIWGDQRESDRRLGRGRVFRDIVPAEALARLGVPPDFSGPDELTWIHRRAKDHDIYFIASPAKRARHVTCEFRITGRRAELWNPENGSIRPLESRPGPADRTTLNFPLGPYGSAFIVFRDGPPLAPAIASISSAGRSLYPPPPPAPAAPTPRDSFTYAVWAKPAATIELPYPSDRGFEGLSHRRNDAFFPPPGHMHLGRGGAFSGLSIGTNGVVVYEHAGSYFPPVLVHAARLDDWTHVAVTYRAGKPTLFLNGKPVRDGVKGSFSPHSPVGFESEGGNPFDGLLGSFDSFPNPLDEAALTSWLASNKPQPDDGTIPDPPLEITRQPDGHIQAIAHRSGRYEVTFADGTRRSVDAEVPPALRLTGPWTLAFPADSGAPASLTLPTLRSWSLIESPDVRHFSGTACYRIDFDLPALPPHAVLDLGRFEVMARVRLNGRDLGILWKAPYRLDLAAAAKPGRNHLEVEVVNLWANRLIGDEALKPDGKRDKAGVLLEWPRWLLDGKPSPSGRRSFVTFPLWKKNEALRPSGLLGPVTLRFPQKLRVD